MSNNGTLMNGTSHNGNNSMGGNGTASLYPYHPSLAVTIFGAIFFVSVAFVHLVQFFKYRAWLFFVLLIGVYMDACGIVARLASVRDTTNPYSWIVSYITLILAPSFVAAACYVTFGRIVWLVTPAKERRFRTLWCPPRWITFVFVVFDLLSFCVQLLGAGAMGSAYTDNSLTEAQRDEKSREGLDTLRLGLVLQLICFGFFAVIGVRFLFVSRKWADRPLIHEMPPKANWVRLNWTINIAATLIMLRAVYRMFEFDRDRNHPGYLQLHEWPFWLLDALPMLCVFIMFAVTHPGQHLPLRFRALKLNKRSLINEAKAFNSEYSSTAALHTGNVQTAYTHDGELQASYPLASAYPLQARPPYGQP